MTTKKITISSRYDSMPGGGAWIKTTTDNDNNPLFKRRRHGASLKRKLKHNPRQRCWRNLVILLATSMFTTPPTSFVSAFSQDVSLLSRMPLFRRDQHRIRENHSLARHLVAAAPKRSSSSHEDDDDEREADGDAVSPWLKWMTGGKPRESSKVKMREAVELGGIPRSDRYSSRDWLHNTLSLPFSAILKDIRSPLIAMTSWATFLSVLHRHLLRTNPLAAEAMCIPGTPHSLMVSALGLLLVFRTNSAYQRFAEGRQIWEHIVNVSRDLYRLVTLYEVEIGSDKRRRIQQLLAAFPYLLRHRIRPSLVMKRLDDDQFKRDPEQTILLYPEMVKNDNDAEAAAMATAEENTGKSRRPTRTLYYVDKRSLPWRLLPSPGTLEKCARAQNRPLWVCDRMAMELRDVPDGPNFTARERFALLSHVDHLSRCIGACERIHQTVVPLNYARHSLRALTLWLLSLPFCLVKDLKLLTGPMLFLVSWLLFGVYEIGYSIEDPFQGTLRLSILCDTIRREVLADEYIRITAFTLETSPNHESSKKASDDDDDDDDDEREGSDNEFYQGVNGKEGSEPKGSSNNNKVPLKVGSFL